MRHLLIAALVFGCSATGAGPLPGRKIAHAYDEPAAQPNAAAPKAGASADTGQVIVDVYGLHDQTGELNVGIYTGAAGFPKNPNAAFVQRTVPIPYRAVRLVFDNVPAGPVAIAVHHDENSNGKMDTGAFGMPTEGYGFSRDAKANFGPPNFGAARVTLADGQSMRVAVHMRY